MDTPSVEQFVGCITSSGLLPSEEVQSILEGLRGAKRSGTAEELARELVAAGKLTRYQVTALYQGRALALGDYLIIDKIGAGGMGQVLKAQHRRMKRVVAIKVLPQSATKTADAVKRFQREAEAAARLLHPNIVAAFDAGRAGNTYFLVMEYVDGEDLSSMVRKQGALPVGDVISYMLQAARGLAYAHGEGVVHRDIKPGNLLVDKKGTVKILDMGLARFDDQNAATAAAREGLTHSGQVMGTVDYMAPEQAFDTRSADARADIYSLGCSMYKLLTGENVYEGETLIQKILAHRDEPIPSLCEKRPVVPAALDEIFSRMVAKKPQQRFQTMDEVVAALAELAGEPATAAAEGSAALDAELSAFFGAVGSATSSVSQRSAARRAQASQAAEATQAAAAEDADTDPAFSAKSHQRAESSVPLPRPGRARQALNPKLLLGGGLGLLVVVVAVAALLLSRSSHEAPGSAVAVTSASGGGGGAGPAASPAQAPPLAIAPFDARQARAHQQAWARHMGVPVESTNSLGMKLVMIPPGQFMMGTDEVTLKKWIAEELGPERVESEFRTTEVPAHRVRISRPFLLASCETTVAQFERFVEATGHTPDSEIHGSQGWKSHAEYRVFGDQYNWRQPGYAVGGDFPVGCVTFADAVEFCNWLSRQEGLSPCYTRTLQGWLRTIGNGYRLPTEAEWEYACRAGTTGIRFWPDTPGDVNAQRDQFHRYVANGGSWSGGPVDTFLQAGPVGTRQPNPFGLYDMLGNVAERCFDWYSSSQYQVDAAGVIDPQGVIDPEGAPIGSPNAVRGLVGAPLFQRSARRDSSSSPYHLTGFRVARELIGDSLPMPRPLPGD